MVKKKATYYLPEAIIKAIKRYAIAHDLSFSEVIEQLVKESLIK